MTSDSQKAALIRNDIPVPFQFPHAPSRYLSGAFVHFSGGLNLLRIGDFLNRIPSLIASR